MRIAFALFSVCCILMLSSCKKTKVDNETTSATDFSVLHQEFMQILSAVNERAAVKKGLGSTTISTFSACPIDTLTGDTTHDALGVFTNTTNLPFLWINYANCTGPDGKTRNGSIKVSFTKKYNLIGTVATATLTNYTVNGATFQGTISITRNSANSFTYNVTDGTYIGTWSTKYSCSMEATLSDNGTAAVADDYVLFLGNANGTNHDNRKYSVTISESLKKRADCAWISQGIVSITPDGLSTRVINYGNGNCDDIASFVLDSQTFTLHMSK